MKQNTVSNVPAKRENNIDLNELLEKLYFRALIGIVALAVLFVDFWSFLHQMIPSIWGEFAIVVGIIAAVVGLVVSCSGLTLILSYWKYQRIAREVK